MKHPSSVAGWQHRHTRWSSSHGRFSVRRSRHRALPVQSPTRVMRCNDRKRERLCAWLVLDLIARYRMSSQATTLNLTVKRLEILPAYRVDDSVIFLDREGGYCYSLNRTGARIWDLLAEPSSVDAICKSLCAEFAVDRQTCEDDVLEVLASMRKAALVA